MLVWLGSIGGASRSLVVAAWCLLPGGGALLVLRTSGLARRLVRRRRRSWPGSTPCFYAEHSTTVQHARGLGYQGNLVGGYARVVLVVQ
jgi:hypothetical protein